MMVVGEWKAVTSLSSVERPPSARAHITSAPSNVSLPRQRERGWTVCQPRWSRQGPGMESKQMFAIFLAACQTSKEFWKNYGRSKCQSHYYLWELLQISVACALCIPCTLWSKSKQFPIWGVFYIPRIGVASVRSRSAVASSLFEISIFSVITLHICRTISSVHCHWTACG